jgi:hypothetical protein
VGDVDQQRRERKRERERREREGRGREGRGEGNKKREGEKVCLLNREENYRRVCNYVHCT